MASYTARKNKAGEIVSYQIKVTRGRDKLTGKQIAVEGGSAGYSQATENFKTSTIKEVGSQVDALLEVSAGTSDACIIDYVLAKSLLKNVD